MNAPQVPFIICVVFYAFAAYATTVHDSTPIPKDDLMKKVEIYDGVSVILPETNTTNKLFSIEVNTNSSAMEEGRGKQKKLMERILPLFIMPFLIQSAIIPMFLSVLKFMLFKALMVGKLAMGFIILNAFRNHNVVKGRDTEIAELHYGYQGNDMYEYGAYINH